MPFVAAMLGSAAIGALGSFGAASTQASGQQQAANTQLQMFNTINQQQQPFIQGGYTSLNQILSGLGPGGQFSRGFTPTDFLNNLDPGYQFQLQTGGQALRNADTPGVGALSGPALKDLMSFNQGMAATGYQNAFNRFQAQNNAVFGRLSAIAGLGQNAAANVGTAGTTLGTGVAGAQAGAAASQAGGIVGATNAVGGSAIPLAYLLNQNPSGGGSGTGGTFPTGNYDPYQSGWGTGPDPGFGAPSS